MKAVGWLIFLALTKGFLFSKASSSVNFKVEEHFATAKEGSCIELKCKVIGDVSNTDPHWVWLKNPVFNKNSRDYDGTVVYSSHKQERPADPTYNDRVRYIGSPSESWNRASGETTLCSILICNLNKSDSGKYALRYYGSDPKSNWYTEPGVTVTVTDNPCPITFEQPGAVKENNPVSLTCSTLSTCDLNLEFKGLPQQHSTEHSQKSISTSFRVTEEDDGGVISCQTLNNRDPYLIKNVTLTVEYPPRDIKATATPTEGSVIKEGQSVTLTCSAKGQPEPTFTWSKPGPLGQSGAEWNFLSIQESDNGVYTCEARNNHGNLSASVQINVAYPPKVQVTTSSDIVTENERITLTCKVIRSNPDPYNYEWLKNEMKVATGRTYVIGRATHEDKGNYKCRATNTVGRGTSGQRNIEVRYGPRDTQISISPNDINVRVGTSITFTCTADANPRPSRYSWHRYSDTVRQVVSSQWRSVTYDRNNQQRVNVQRTDEACYVCNATNDIGTGYNSNPLCIKVLYPPTKPTLTMDSLVEEGQHATISCTVESFPPSELTLTRTAAPNSQSKQLVFTHPSTQQSKNLQYTFNVSSAYKGFYTCNARNIIGSSSSDAKEMVVKYSPKDVKVQAEPDFTVDEYTRLKLRCSANSYPPEMSFIWTKTKDGKSETIGEAETFTVQSVSPSDRGSYSCAASNKMGTGKSQKAEIIVRYAPKHTKITKGVEMLNRDGKKSLTLSCSGDGYPEPKEFSWHKTDPKGTDQKVSVLQTHTVYSDQPGEYYCIAKNDLNQKSSEPIPVFVDRGWMKILIIIFLLITLLTLLAVLVYRHKRNKAARRRLSNDQSFLNSLDWWAGTRSNRLTNEQPFRSRDDLLPDQPCHSRQQPRPDSTPAPNVSTVYCTVTHPGKAQAPSRETPIQQKAGPTQDESLNYASLHFGKKQKTKQAKEETDVVYAMVSKKNPPKKTEQKNFEDYENIKKAPGAKSPTPVDGSDTSEDEVELNYTQVSFKAKPGHQRERRDSSSSEDEIEYSDVKM